VPVVSVGAETCIGQLLLQQINQCCVAEMLSGYRLSLFNSVVFAISVALEVHRALGFARWWVRIVLSCTCTQFRESRCPDFGMLMLLGDSQAVSSPMVPKTIVALSYRRLKASLAACSSFFPPAASGSLLSAHQTAWSGLRPVVSPERLC
jgi:hypothetical protein